MKKVLLFVAALFCCSFVAQAATVQVAAGEKALLAAVTAASAGDVLELGTGTFTEWDAITLEKQLTIKAAEGAKPVVKIYSFKFSAGSEGSVIDGLEVENLSNDNYLFRTGGNVAGSLTFKNCVMHNKKAETTNPTPYFYLSSNTVETLTIDNCIFTDNDKTEGAIVYGSSATVTNFNMTNSTAYNMPNELAVRLENLTNAYVDHCTFYNCGTRVLYLKGMTTSLIQNCIVANPVATSNYCIASYAGDVKNVMYYNTNAPRSGSTNTDCVNADPKFKDAANADFTLMEGSPALTAGTDGKAIGDPRWAPAAEAGMEGAFTVGGEGADFASLYAACDSVNKAVLAGNLAGDIELLIAADLVEPKNIGLINTTDYTVTIRPDKDVDRTVLFTQSTDNDGPSGAFVIGCDMGITFTGIATKNIVIDGFAENGDTRRLTFTTTDGFGSKAGPVVFYGDVTNSVIKNCIVTNTIYHSSTSAYAITLRNEKSTDKCPVGVIIENNKLEVIVADNGQGIYLNGSQAATAKVGAPKNTVVRNNEIIAATRGIFVYGANGLIAEGNTIRVRQHAGGRLSHGILGNSQTGVMTIRGNKFVELTTVNTTTGDYGIQAITASGGASVWMIENNFFGGFDAGTACAGKPTKICGVRMGDSCVVRHNTFVMPVLSNTPSTTLLTNAPITLLYYAGTLNYVVENNIFVSHETAANNSLARGTITSNTKNNLYFLAPAEGSKAVVMDAAAPAATFADLSDDIKAANISVAVAFDSLYVLTDASMTSAIGVPAIAEITTDIEGNTRNTPKVIPGCYEPKDINQGEPTSIEEIGVEGVDVRKVIRDGQLYIIRDGVTYNIQGQIVR